MTKERLQEILENPSVSIIKAKELVAIFTREQEKSKWLASQRTEYDKLFPTQRAMTAKEKGIYDSNNFAVDNPKPTDFTYPLVDIAYSKDTTYMAFNGWLNETRVVTPYIDAVVDEHGMTIKESVKEVTELIRPYTEPSDYDVEALVSSSELYKNTVTIKSTSTRDELLNKGAVSQNGKMWFNKETFLEFATEYGTMEADDILIWRDANRDKIKLTKAEVKVYILEGKALIKKVYGLE